MIVLSFLMLFIFTTNQQKSPSRHHHARRRPTTYWSCVTSHAPLTVTALDFVKSQRQMHRHHRHHHHVDDHSHVMVVEDEHGSLEDLASLIDPDDLEEPDYGIGGTIDDFVRGRVSMPSLFLLKMFPKSPSTRNLLDERNRDRQKRTAPFACLLALLLTG